MDTVKICYLERVFCFCLYGVYAELLDLDECQMSLAVLLRHFINGKISETELRLSGLPSLLMWMVKDWLDSESGVHAVKVCPSLLVRHIVVCC